jgi:glycosyltransferase involved in cell wall biosynthesis
MKVLMFGWEFPPHISGGLGTACFGLTQALLENEVKVFFVVPRLHGDEQAKDVTLINASEIDVARGEVQQPENSKASGPSSRATKSAAASGHQRPTVTAPLGKEVSLTYIEAMSALAPYESLNRESQRCELSLTAWNYTFHNGNTANAVDTEALASAQSHDRNGQPGRYAFSGRYGNNLMEEAQAYGRVGAVLGSKHVFDVIHAHDWMTFLAGIEAKKASKKPLVVHVHSTEFDRSGEHINKSVFEIERRGLRESDGIIAVSNWTKEILVARYGISAKKIRVIHNGIIPREHPGVFSFPDVASHWITFLGRVTHQKGPRFFVEAARKVLQEFPDAHFIVAGAGDLLPQMIERVAQLNMSSNFHFTGFLTGDQVDQVWSMTDVYVMPSVSEPFGIAPLEAIQGGVPVILSNQSGVSEVMPHAIKVDFWDVKALAAAICSVLRYESLSQVLRQNSRQHIQHLTWDKAARNVKALYHEFTGK